MLLFISELSNFSQSAQISTIQELVEEGDGGDDIGEITMDERYICKYYNKWSISKVLIIIILPPLCSRLEEQNSSESPSVPSHSSTHRAQPKKRCREVEPVDEALINSLKEVTAYYLYRFFWHAQK